ncbi:Mor transcription activator family protein [Clostridium sp. AF27-2AA]|nr:Mor transcription activator family protein [Clostridium sp. AF27-2AA]
MAGIYREIAEIAGEEIARTIHANFKGQQVVFPNKLYSSQYIAEKIQLEYDGKNIRQLAMKYGYTERWLRKIIKDAEER